MFAGDDGPRSNSSAISIAGNGVAGTAALWWMVLRAMRPAQWLKNGVLFAGLVFGGKLFDPEAFGRAVAAAGFFCLLSGGFYLINDVRDFQADQLHPVKQRRPVASGELPRALALRVGLVLIAMALAGSWLLGSGFFLALAAYTGLMAAYNLGLKQVVILDVLAIALGFVIRAAAGAIAVNVAISPWLLTCTLLLALLIAFGKRRNELASLAEAGRHRRNLESYSVTLLDQAVAVTAGGSLIAYAIYTFDAESAPQDHRMVLTVPIVAYGIFRYLFLLYRRGEGGTPEAMLFTDRYLLAAVVLWGLGSTVLFYLAS